MQIYGTFEPVDIMANMDKIDIPTYFIMGLRDSLIEPISIMKLHGAMYKSHADLAFLKVIWAQILY